MFWAGRINEDLPNNEIPGICLDRVKLFFFPYVLFGIYAIVVKDPGE